MNEVEVQEKITRNKAVQIPAGLFLLIVGTLVCINAGPTTWGGVVSGLFAVSGLIVVLTAWKRN